MQTIKDLKQYTFPALLNNTLSKFSSRPALSFVNGTPLTYEQIESKVKEVSALLHSLGIKKGDKVSIFSTSMPNWGGKLFWYCKYGSYCSSFVARF